MPVKQNFIFVKFCKIYLHGVDKACNMCDNKRVDKTKEVTNMTTTEEKDLVKTIDDLQWDNMTGEAMLAVAEYVDDKELIKGFNDVLDRHEQIGYITIELREERQNLYNTMKEKYIGVFNRLKINI